MASHQWVPLVEWSETSACASVGLISEDEIRLQQYSLERTNRGGAGRLEEEGGVIRLSFTLHVQCLNPVYRLWTFTNAQPA